MASNLLKLLADEVNPTWLWENQGSAVVAQLSSGSPMLWAPAGTGDNLRIRKKAAPVRYRIDAKVRVLLGGELGLAGLCWRESSTRRVITAGVYMNTGVAVFSVDKYTLPTTFSANATTQNNPFVGHSFYLRLEDDGVNRRAYFGVDGGQRLNSLGAVDPWAAQVNWEPMYSETRTTFLTANEIGVFAVAYNATFPCGIVVDSWTEREYPG